MASHGILEGMSDAANRPTDPDKETLFLKRRTAHGSTQNDMDTCRICRGEGTEEEPLFYPCKCSGSIKFVHQECLMEWLSHSNKKHCELCKTPFRFTKLYDPQMPKTLPAPIFIRKVVSRGIALVITWLRFTLVCLVWLGWLPWSMRAGWRLLFWLGDGGWASWDNPNTGLKTGHPAPVTLQGSPQKLLINPAVILRQVSLAASRTRDFGAESLSGATFPTSEAIRRVMQTLQEKPDEFRAFTLLDKLLSMLGLRTTQPLPVPSSASSAEHLNYASGHGPQQISLLSNITFLNQLTPSISFNRMIVDTLEGQIITLSVVVAFILIFLIREWVVQQQFGVNIARPVNGELEPAPPADVEVAAQAHLPDQPPEIAVDTRPQGPNSQAFEDALGPSNSTHPIKPAPERHVNDRDEEETWDLVQSYPEASSITAEPSSPWARNENNLTSIRPAQQSDGGATTGSQTKGNLSIPALTTSSQISTKANEHDDAVAQSYLRRPPLPSRNTSSTAALIQRIIEEDGISPEEESFPLQLLTIWVQANCNASDFIRILLEERQATGLTDVLEALRRLQKMDPEHELATALSTITALVEQADGEPGLRDKNTHIDKNFQASGKNQPSSKLEPLAEPKLDKGKGKAVDASNPPDETIAALQLSSSDIQGSSTVKGRISKHQETNSKKIPQPPIDGPSTSSTSCVENKLSSGPEDESRVEKDSDRQMASPLRVRSTPSFERGQAVTDTLPTIQDNPRDARSDRLNTAPAILPGQESELTTSATDRPQLARQGIHYRVLDWLWDDVAAEQPDHEAQPADNGQDVRDPNIEQVNPIAGEQLNGPEQLGAPDARLERVDRQAPLVPAPNPGDPDLFDDGDDFDGVMELAGLRGPLTGLFQNAVFSLVLLSATVAGGIWIPYLWGKVVLVILANPFSILVKLPFRSFSVFADLVTDLTLFSAGCLLYRVDSLARTILAFCTPAFPFLGSYAQSTVIASWTHVIAERAFERIADTFAAASFGFSATDYPVFSIASHEALQSLKYTSLSFLNHVSQELASMYRFSSRLAWSSAPDQVIENHTRTSVHVFGQSLLAMLSSAWKSIQNILVSLGTRRAFRLPFEIPSPTIGSDPSSTTYWTATDRIIVVVAGYVFFSLIGAMYVKKGTPFSTSEQGKKVEGMIRAVLVQAGGVLKVILIISIEMIIFPLYCGMLLDIALLPLFAGATICSRMNFTIHSPWTSAFIHWFVGTCYMFHFALFVSMCRKILRAGVLYFIRDPDDPTFHPVRDVLERNVTSQLRKIAFSALVYGALVILCLGGVVWGLAYSYPGVLPIHWSSNEPVLEFPVDLLFYNFLVPVAMKFLRPSDGLHTMYKWWFRKCARLLRLTGFLFGERKQDEEGHYVRSTWTALVPLKGGGAMESTLIKDRDSRPDATTTEASFVRDGRFVRSPGSDQVRIPKGGQVFLDTTETDEMTEAQPVSSQVSEDENLKLYAKVYIPPWFRIRIGLFILLIWIFAAITGISVTIVPLVFGRMIFSQLIPDHLRMNDVYAFSIGIYILGSVLYSALHYDRGVARVKRSLSLHFGSLAQAFPMAYRIGRDFVRLLYALTAFAVVLPGLFAFLIELYVVIPMHTYVAAEEKHVIHLVQDWTLGVLYVKIAGGFILWHSNSRPARALIAITRHGWLRPDIGLATRFFILPATVAMVFAIIAPLCLAWLAITLRLNDLAGLSQSDVYRYSYPTVLITCANAGLIYLFDSMVKRWRQTIRDEVYLIGERLHNLGESRNVRVATVEA